jgi:hypothetical protein
MMATSAGLLMFFRGQRAEPVATHMAHSTDMVGFDVHPMLPMFATGGGAQDMGYRLWMREVPEEEEDAGSLTGGLDPE